MPIQSSASGADPVKLSELSTEFGSSGTVSLLDYLRYPGGSLVPDTQLNRDVGIPTSAPVTLLDFLSGSNVRIRIENASVAKIARGANNAASLYRIASNGSVILTEADGGSTVRKTHFANNKIATVTNSGTPSYTQGTDATAGMGWAKELTPALDATLYSVRATLVSGSVNTDGYASTGVWYGCETSPEWRVLAGSGIGGSQSATLTVEIRRDSNLVVLDSASISLSATWESLA